jgi:ATP-dependent DNA helicase RecG
MISTETPLSKITRVLEPEARALKKLGIMTAIDLLYHFPVRYGDTSDVTNIVSLERGQTAVVFGKITKLKTSKGFRSRIPMASAEVTDESGHIQCVWFNQPYLAKMIPEGAFVRIEGKVSQRKVKPVKVGIVGEVAKESLEKVNASKEAAEEPLREMSESKESDTSLKKLLWGKKDSEEPLRDEGLSERESARVNAAGAEDDVGPRMQRSEAADAPSKGPLYFSNPKIEKIDKLPTGVGHSLFGAKGTAEAEQHTMYPVYAESRGVTSNWMYHALQKIFKSGLLETIQDPLPTEILEKYNLPGLRTALIWVHTPIKHDDAAAARKRFAFEEIFFIQLEKQAARREYEKNPSFRVEASEKMVSEFVKRFPFPATDAQNRAINSIVTDMQSGKAMSRLLEGDVGSGKTAVAASAAYAVVASRPTGQKYGNLQVAYMCPTEILATQHFESFIQYFSYLGINIGLITGSGCRKFPSKINPKGWTDISRTQLLKWVAEGDMPILIGTHALIQKAVNFKHLALAIIDEQHRFGTRQRAELIRKNAESKTAKTAAKMAPHLLSMTATPIPRTLALTMYGDLDLTLLDQMPAGRKQIITKIVTPTGRDEMYATMRHELTIGRQGYVICPRIDEPDPDKELALEAKSVIAEAKRLKKSVFPEYSIGVLHSKMKPDDKDRVMLDFKAGKINILCATSVIEVGVNVPNATCIIIEGAERFGLAQLHQLRGRVMRSTHQAHCFIFAEKAAEKTLTRLKNFTRAANGFELAEYDLAERGTGDLSGLKQWGISDIAMEALRNLKMVEAARTEAGRLLDADISLSRFPLVKKELGARKTNALHFE